jgi:hypothetical protein
MNYIRTKVSADRRRYQSGDFDLDLTFITPSILGKF